MCCEGEVELLGCFLHLLACGFDALAKLGYAHLLYDGVGYALCGRWGLDVGAAVSDFALYVEKVCHRACFLYLGGGDVVLVIVLYLLSSAAVGLVDGLLHGCGYAVGIEYGAAVDVAGGSAYGLGEAAVAAEKAFFVGIENGYE